MENLLRGALIVFTSSVFTLTTSANNSCTDMIWLSKDACLTLDYNKEDQPSPKMDVLMNFRIHGVNEVNDNAQTVTMVMNLEMSWQDPRIVLADEDNFNRSYINAEGHTKLWLPEIYIERIIEFKVLKVLKKLSGMVMIGKTDLYFYTTAIVTVHCPMTFTDYPFDQQDCKFYISSPIAPVELIEFHTSRVDYMDNSTIKPSIVWFSSIPEEETIHEYYDYGHVFSTAGFVLHTKRWRSAYVIKYYMPCAMMVMVSCINFVIPPDAIPGRTGLLVTIFLVLITIFGAVQVVERHLPSNVL